MIYIGADHRGFDLKEEIKKYLTSRLLHFQDMGAEGKVENDDYPVYAKKVAQGVDHTKDLGILICGSGHGVCVAANKIKGVRASVVDSPESAKAGRNDDNLNIICLASDTTTPESAIAIVESFIDTDFSGEERHIRRLKEVEELEA